MLDCVEGKRKLGGYEIAGKRGGDGIEEKASDNSEQNKRAGECSLLGRAFRGPCT